MKMGTYIVVCKANLVHSERHRFQDSVQRGGQPTEVHQRLRTVAGADLYILTTESVFVYVIQNEHTNGCHTEGAL